MSYVNEEQDDYWYDDPGGTNAQGSGEAPEEADEEGPRYAWKVASWIVVALTLIMNIIIVGVIIINRNANSVVNKGTQILNYT